MSKRILFLSTVNLTTNPRIFKEIRLASGLGITTTFIGFKLNNWSDGMDLIAEKEVPATLIAYLNAGRQPFIPWVYATVIEKLSRIFYSFLPNNLKVNAYGCTKRSFRLEHLFKKLSNEKFDLIVAHTLAALYPAKKYADKIGCPFAFDVEDYHPGEFIETDATNEKKRRLYLLRSLLPKAKYISCASPLIETKIRNLIGTTQQDIFTVNNYFPSNLFKVPVINNSRQIKLVWFSQNIDKGRGLELLFSALENLANIFHLTLIGNMNEEFYAQYIEPLPYKISIIPPLPSGKLYAELSKYDAGLALELVSVDQNRNIALTNKLLAYHQAGLFILATDTEGQAQFIESFPNAGLTCSQTQAGIEEKLKYIEVSIEDIRKNSLTRYEQARKTCWESECQKLINRWMEK